MDLETLELIARALREDHAENDLSTLWTIPSEACAKAILIARQEGVFCGGEIFSETFKLLCPTIKAQLLASDGDIVARDAIVARLHGPAQAILSAERVALNLVGRFSGIATAARRLVEIVRGTRAVICDTRKTMPLWRKWDKYAVRAGGADNHRFNLEDMVLLKDNHVALAGGAVEALRLVKSRNEAKVPVEVEVENLNQLRQLLEEGVDRALLDNMTLEEMREAVEITGGRALLEASGGITAENLRAVAETGVDIISIGALTHSVKAFDFSLEIEIISG